jgi:hypothetical protein
VRVEDLKVSSRERDSITGKKTANPQSLFVIVSVFEIVCCSHLKRHLIVRKKIKLEEI